MKKEFSNDEMKDAVNNSLLPPLDTILKNNSAQVATLTESEHVATFDVTPDLRIIVSLQEKSEYEPHLIVAAGADPGVIHIIINKDSPLLRVHRSYRRDQINAFASISTMPLPNIRSRNYRVE